MNKEIINFKEIIRSDISREKRARLLSDLWIIILRGGGFQRQVNYQKTKIKSYLDISDQLRHLEQEEKIEVFEMFVISSLMKEIKDLEENVYDLESVLHQLIKLGLLVKETKEFSKNSSKHDFSELYKIHQEAKILFHKIIEKRETGGDWTIYKSINDKQYYCTNTYMDGYGQDTFMLVEGDELETAIFKIIEQTYDETCSGAADFILKKEGFLGWSNKKYYI